MKFLIVYTIILISMGSIAKSHAGKTIESESSDSVAYSLGGINRTAEGVIVKVEGYGNYFDSSLKEMFLTPSYFIGSNADVVNKWVSQNDERSTVESIDDDIRDKVKLLEVCNESGKRKGSITKTLEYASKTNSKVRVVYFDNGHKLAGMCIESIAVLTNFE